MYLFIFGGSSGIRWNVKEQHKIVHETWLWLLYLAVEVPRPCQSGFYIVWEGGKEGGGVRKEEENLDYNPEALVV